MFSPGRNWEQIRTTLAYNDRKAVIVGSHAGVSVGPDGGTHQAIEDIALMRVVPRMTVISPCDAIQARQATLALAAHPTLAYPRLAREKTPVITTEETPFELGKGQILYRPDGIAHVGIIATGALVSQALRAAKELEEKNHLKAIVVNIHTIKPLDTDLIRAVAKETKAIVTVEEHSVIGGLGSAVAEYKALKRNAPPQLLLGLPDKFDVTGDYRFLLERHGLVASKIFDKVLAFLNSNS